MGKEGCKEVEDNVDQDVMTNDEEEAEEGVGLVLNVVGQPDPVGDKDHRGGEEDHHCHKDGPKYKCKAINKPKGWLHQCVKHIIGTEKDHQVVDMFSQSLNLRWQL